MFHSTKWSGMRLQRKELTRQSRRRRRRRRRRFRPMSCSLRMHKVGLATATEGHCTVMIMNWGDSWGKQPQLQ